MGGATVPQGITSPPITGLRTSSAGAQLTDQVTCLDDDADEPGHDGRLLENYSYVTFIPSRW